MLRIAICDDNADFVQHTLDIIDCWPSKPLNTLCETFDNGDELVCAHRNAPFDIILLDVIMPMLNGIETARELRLIDKNTKIAFLTSSSEYAVESYTVKAGNYLLKPIASLILLFGVYLSAAFAGIRFTSKNILICFILCVLSGALQLGTYAIFSEAVVWKIYPLISHLPLFLLLYVVYRKKDDFILHRPY